MFGGQDSDTRPRMANAREGEVFNRVDEEQVQKFNEIVEILLVGGYFRARIAGLTPFDKVIGGMAWCISSSNVDVDVDILFQENLVIGQRIKLSEALLVALRKMKCPYPLQAQQIQGLDYINLFPVIQWLITKVIETREETGDLTRMYSESQFNKTFKIPHEVEQEATKKEAIAYVKETKNRYRPVRRLRRQKQSAPTPQATLLEYGKANRMSRAATDKKQQAESAGKDEAAAEEMHIQKLMNTLDKVGEQKVSNVSDFITADDIQKVATQFSSMDAVTAGVGQKQLVERQHKQNVAMLERKIEQNTTLYKTTKQEFDEESKKVEAIQDQVATKSAFNERIVTETLKLDQLETPENAKQLLMLRNLVGMNDSLRTQEAQFKGNCKRQMMELKGLIEAGHTENPTDVDAERKKLVEDTFAADTEKFRKVKQLLAKKSREIAQVEWKIDEVPSRTELMQYQRQFVDLYEQVASRLIETRQYFSSFNTLEDTRTVLAREVSILNSIHDNYKTAMKNKGTAAQLLESMDGIVKGVLKSLENEENKLAREKKTADDLNDRYMKLVEKERSFYKASKEFQEECKKNERLTAQA